MEDVRPTLLVLDWSLPYCWSVFPLTLWLIGECQIFFNQLCPKP